MSETTETVKANICHAEDKEKLDSIATSIANKLIENKDGSTMTEEHKDTVYGELKATWDELASTIRQFRFNFPLTKGEFNYVYDLIVNKLDYTSQTVFIGLRIQEEFLNVTDSKYASDTEVKNHLINPNIMMLVYHLLDNHKVPGLNGKARVFASIIRKLGEISIEFEKMDKQSKELSIAINDWVVSVTPEEGPTADSVPADQELVPAEEGK